MPRKVVFDYLSDNASRRKACRRINTVIGSAAYIANLTGATVIVLAHNVETGCRHVFASDGERTLAALPSLLAKFSFAAKNMYLEPNDLSGSTDKMRVSAVFELMATRVTNGSYPSNLATDDGTKSSAGNGAAASSAAPRRASVYCADATKRKADYKRLAPPLLKLALMLSRLTRFQITVLVNSVEFDSTYISHSPRVGAADKAPILLSDYCGGRLPPFVVGTDFYYEASDFAGTENMATTKFSSAWRDNVQQRRVDSATGYPAILLASSASASSAPLSAARKRGHAEISAPLAPRAVAVTPEITRAAAAATIKARRTPLAPAKAQNVATSATVEPQSQSSVITPRFGSTKMRRLNDESETTASVMDILGRTISFPVLPTFLDYSNQPCSANEMALAAASAEAASLDLEDDDSAIFEHMLSGTTSAPHAPNDLLDDADAQFEREAALCTRQWYAELSLNSTDMNFLEPAQHDPYMMVDHLHLSNAFTLGEFDQLEHLLLANT